MGIVVSWDFGRPHASPRLLVLTFDRQFRVFTANGRVIRSVFSPLRNRTTKPPIGENFPKLDLTSDVARFSAANFVLNSGDLAGKLHYSPPGYGENGRQQTRWRRRQSRANPSLGNRPPLFTGNFSGKCGDLAWHSARKPAPQAGFRDHSSSRKP